VKSRGRPGLLAAIEIGWRAAPFITVALAGLQLVAGAIPALMAWLGKLLIDELAMGTNANASEAVMFAVAGAVAAAGAAVLGAATALADTALQRRIGLEAEQRLYAQINSFAGMETFEDSKFQDRLRLAQQAAQSAPISILTFVWECVRAVVSLSSFLGLLLVFWPPSVLLLAAAAVPALLAQLALARRQVSHLETTMATHRRHAMLQFLLTDPQSVKEIRLYGLGRLLLGRMIKALRDMSGASLRLERRGAMVQSLLAVLTAVIASVIALVVVRAVLSGRLTLGDMALFTAAVAGTQSTLASIAQQVGSVRGELRLFRNYLDILTAAPDLPNGSAVVPPLRRGIEFHDVWFRYGHGPWVLKGVNLFLAAGTTVGLVGVNGAGKSTIVKLLCRFYDPQRGAIHWDGADLRGFDIDSLRRRISTTFQDFMTYEMSAAENIGVGDVEQLECRERIVDAARLAGIHGSIVALPKGYQTLLSNVFLDEHDGTRGVVLSGGQRQRLAVARSFMRAAPDLLVLDEPTSGLDAEAEYRQHQTLLGANRGTVRLLVSHRLSTIRGATAIAVVVDGRVAEFGDHDQLMSAAGTYARLFSMQAVNYQDHRVVTGGESWLGA